jgi:hypothetical protein
MRVGLREQDVVLPEGPPGTINVRKGKPRLKSFRPGCRTQYEIHDRLRVGKAVGVMTDAGFADHGNAAA